MSRNIKGLYTELAFEDGAALVDESIVREQLRQKRLNCLLYTSPSPRDRV